MKSMSQSNSKKNNAEAIKVIVRIRPLSKSEIIAKRKIITIANEERGVIQVRNPTQPDTEPPKIFTFDSVLSDTCTQKFLYDKCAAPIVHSVLQGYNGTVFAYGQTGAGKTWTMEGDVGSEECKGIIPRACQHIFDHIALSNDIKEKYLVRASYFEIYNEEIRDLLSNTPKKSLDLKESSETGVYVKNLSSIAVKTTDEIDHVMQRGKNNRAVASTNMNAGSSRSHSVFSIVVECCTSDERGEHIRVGKLNLVDLAGSERQGKTGATGERLKEATKINLSLSALGNVISALVDGKSLHVPYRDSKLTRILQDSLGGNTKTVMCANAGPAEYNYDETLSTLRYANRAKNIKNKPIVNEDPKDAMLREYQDEIAKLRSQLSKITPNSSNCDRNEPKDGNIQSNDFQVNESESNDALRELQERSEKEKQEIEDRSKAQMKKLLHKHNETSSERKALEIKLHQESKARSEIETQRRMLQEKLKDMEAKLMVGGEIASKAAKQEAALRKAEQDLIARKELELCLSRQMAEREEANLVLEEKYTSLNEEIQIKTKKLKKIFTKFQQAKTEIKDLQSEFQLEKDDLLETIRDLNRQLSLKELIISNFIPQKEVRKFDDVKNGGRAVWNEDEQRWEIPRLNLSGNAILMKKRMMNNQGLSRPETEYSRKMRTKDSNPRYRQDNIINLEIEMPGRSTESYDGSYRNRTICDILDSSINDEMEELSASSFVENENDVPGNPYFEYDDNRVNASKSRSKNQKSKNEKMKNKDRKRNKDRPRTCR